ncbi:MAG: hypothetical protein US68_C0003G0041 [Candidatus Shapirobacteria bacterium GW2011_GWE1_38_10]|uniref:Uncharacterized protein n=1 Tax=Candidatus Shapirobacteria bacterium GW2011_GWE1_38_10 TaxID=1618488 RepID=A0A0G0II58_9BACT|nr:MAG: hypothetical protein US46_C0008G0011 [Candidatus Shapirobacteria bacterium GW2011_GWF2_37_20]KKQ50675.1 MAG: hypothetical protein US68_C0003G0041 [Candidatus Shapirobacteria bacterium GW2011_GWE1_38_10]KKQ64386.1 MAG: hypothetical protein US85_C0010G0018 [Candidatus Shapirobacteria bacterium GW2011_GWF1_38_23]HBP51624.1 hypothetical protein [Candidatus Shapirobacteria bacterium]
MLPKPDKSSKKSSLEQLDFVETINDADKTKKKRLSILIFLFLTVGVSFCFIAYRQIKNTNFEQIKIPNLSLKLPTVFQSKFSPDIPQNWTFEVLSTGTTLSLKTVNPTPYAKKYLPNGVVVSEKTNSTPDYLEIVSSISTPKTKFEIYAKIPGNINSSSPEIDVFSRLVETFYWHLLNS